MKRILLLFSALMLSCIALWAHDVEIDGIYYNLDKTNKTAKVTYSGAYYYSVSNEYSGSVTIPETITYNSEIYSVTSIGERAFYGCSRLTSVTIPNSVTSIGASAFYDCSGLTKVNYLGTVDKWVEFDFENSNSNPTYYAKDLYINNELLTDVKITSAGSIEDYAFYNYQSIKSVEIGNSVTSIGESAFSGCSGLTSVTIGNSVTSIGYYAFNDCSELTSVTIPNSVTSIGASAFSDCSGLTSVTIGNSVTSIGQYAFSGCSGLTSVTIGNSVTSISLYAFKDCSGLTSVIWNAKNCKDFSSNSSSPFYNSHSRITSFTFGNEVEHIPAYLCYGMYRLKEVTIPNSVTSIGGYAFSGCNGLTEVTIGNSVTSIGLYAFEDCSGLTSVIWNAKHCKDFGYDSSYREYTSPFYNISSNITSFTFGNEVEHIPAYLCYGMSELTEITIPNSVTSIGYVAFLCHGLTKVNYLGTVDKWVEIDFEGYASNPTYNANALYINNELITDVKITTADSIKNYAFSNYQSIKSVEIGESVTSIGSSAFNGCSGLTSVTIGNSVTSIGYNAFYNTGIYEDESNWDNGVLYIDNCLIKAKSDVVKGSYTIKKGTRIIGSSAFEGCSGLTSVTIPNSVTSIDRYAFYNCSGLTSVIWNAKNYKDFEDYDETPFYNIRSSITSFTFGNEVEHIPAYLCYGMSKLTEITIPNSVTSIGSYAFYKCSGLTKVNYLGTVDKWVDIDFEDYRYNPTYYVKDLYINNELLTDVKITTADSIKKYAFYNCQSIKSVEIGNSVTSIGGDAFSGCSGLTKVNYLGTVDKWVEFDFNSSNDNPTYYTKDLYINNELLTDVKITTADSIKNYAFYNCQSIKSVEIGESVTSIGSSAFSGCSGLTSVTIGESVTSIGSSAFSGCDKLRKVTAYPTTVPSVYENSFAHYNAALYVPCDVYDDYFFDDVFGTFKVTECIAAEEVDAPDKVEIEVDEDNNAIVIWPSTDGAKKYELEISKDGEVFCTLLFNENGQLTSIDFGNRSASVGFQFTVTGLDSASKYAYSMVAMDIKGNELQSYKGTFTTNGYVPGPGEEDVPTSITETLADANITVSGGTISADADFSIYNTIGQDVTAFNGSLQPGVYLVSIENNIVKVMVH